jgi:hypothetical protein
MDESVFLKAVKKLVRGAGLSDLITLHSLRRLYRSPRREHVRIIVRHCNNGDLVVRVTLFQKVATLLYAFCLLGKFETGKGIVQVQHMTLECRQYNALLRLSCNEGSQYSTCIFKRSFRQIRDGKVNQRTGVEVSLVGCCPIRLLQKKCGVRVITMF